MNKRNTVYLVILIVLAVIFVISKLDTNREERIRFFAADSNNVARIEIASATDTIHVAKEGEEWRLVYPVNWALQTGKIEKILESVLTAETSSLPVSEKESSLENYSLTDSMATRFKTYDADGKLLDDVFVGKSKSYSNTPVRKADSNKVYRLEENITYSLRPKVSYWRKKEIFELDTENISKVSVMWDENNYSLERGDTTWVYTDMQKELEVLAENKSLTGIINTFKRFTSSGFIDGKYEEYASAFQVPVLQIGLETTYGENYILRYINHDDEKKYILQLNNETETLFEQTESVIMKFQKKAEDFE